MRIALLAFDGFNELDSLIALGILNWVREEKPDWEVRLAGPSQTLRSMNGVSVETQASLDYVHGATLFWSAAVPRPARSSKTRG